MFYLISLIKIVAVLRKKSFFPSNMFFPQQKKTLSIARFFTHAMVYQVHLSFATQFSYFIKILHSKKFKITVQRNIFLPADYKKKQNFFHCKIMFFSHTLIHFRQSRILQNESTQYLLPGKHRSNLCEMAQGDQSRWTC